MSNEAAGDLPVVLRLNRIQYPVHNLGPGRRVGLWVQGCSLACDGCVSPSLWARERGTAVPVETLVEALAVGAAGGEGFDGVTVSGGEPFEQYGALMAFCAYLKSRTSLDVLVFTGFRIEELHQSHPDRAFLRYIDWLIDGRYERARHDGNGWRGSTNQRLFEVRECHARERPPPEGWSVPRVTSVAVPDATRAFFSGIPNEGELEFVGQSLRGLGLKVSFR